MSAAAPRTPARRLRSALRDLAYSPPSRALARLLEERPGVRDALEKRGHGELLRRIASEALPAGHHYARLTLKGWAKHRGADFRLLERGEVVYGNRIQAPPPGTPLEYRNILVTSSDPADFTLDLPVKHQLHIGAGAFSTPEQDAYDRKYHVHRRDGLFSSVRGNTTNPARLLVTFPGFPPANSRVSYAVSYLKALTEEDLADTLMVCFQDRYGVSGTYMVHDNAGRLLAGRVTGAITALMRRHGIAEEDVLVFGASKGASIAAMTARDLPGARQVLVAPQMNLPYYFAKPVLRGGLFRDRALWEVEQPGTLLRRYLAEGRRIDYFYSDPDESSNDSLIEYARDATGLTKHRIGGGHAAVAKKSLPTVLSLLRGFATGTADGTATPLVVTGLTSTAREGAVSHRVQLADDSVPEAANVYLEGWLGSARFRQLLSPGEDPAARFTATGQRTDPALHPEAFTHVVAADGTPTMRRGVVPDAQGRIDEHGAAPERGLAGGADPDERDSARHPLGAPASLTCDAAAPREYALLSASCAPSARFRYLAERLDPSGYVAQLRLVTQVSQQRPTPSAAEHPEPATGFAPSAVRARFTVAALTGWRDLPVLARRIAIAAEVEELQVLADDAAVTTAQLQELAALDWPAVTVAGSDTDRTA
ncbi:hypothetical protein CFK38_04765 [Brachybacterium vulturis]|uniref:Alpha/beta hydrolase n=1 Tax=Brachybacterium vulturis TaxID=2017484 RepID=A0A291GL28_9MICO|nr:hypothetical protein [Brachybacterium vulturis]ATG50915.1 hypothetical protein CFK38_04765 [Brachybacterium vulturis]